MLSITVPSLKSCTCLLVYVVAVATNWYLSYPASRLERWYWLLCILVNWSMAELVVDIYCKWLRILMFICWSLILPNVSKNDTFFCFFFRVDTNDLTGFRRMCLKYLNMRGKSAVLTHRYNILMNIYEHTDKYLCFSKLLCLRTLFCSCYKNQKSIEKVHHALF